MPRNALGKGLGALIREPEPADSPIAIAAPPPTLSLAPPSASGQQMVDIDLIEPSPYQPRTRFREEALEELARSIASNGIIQPLVLRPMGSRYQLIAGERRWRAAQRAGLRRVPAILRDVPEELALEITLVENIQREDLNPIEQARAFERLLTEFHLTQEDVAARTGKDRATVANSLRLLKLEKPVLEAIEDGKITAGHGRALLGVGDPKLRSALASRASRGGLTVRQIERIASRRVRNAARAQDALPADPNIRAAIDELQRHLGTRVSLRPPSSKFPGQLRIEYYEDAQLSGFYEKLMK
jgi:ParB family transcriptional regulator, chromosome partitioning protein